MERWCLKPSNMRNFLTKEQNIIVSGLLQYGKKILVVRSTCMITALNDTEYFNIPSWEVSFGDDPRSMVENSFAELLGVEEIENVYPVDTYSFMRESGAEHTVCIVYRVDVSKTICKNIGECESLHFVDIKDIDSYIFSSRVKDMIRSIV